MGLGGNRRRLCPRTKHTVGACLQAIFLLAGMPSAQRDPIKKAAPNRGGLFLLEFHLREERAQRGD